MTVVLLSQSSRNSHLTPYAQMVLAEVVLLFSAIVVLGATTDLKVRTNVCKGECVYGIISSLFAILVTTAAVVLHLGVALTWLPRRRVNLKLEYMWLCLLLLLWIPTVSCLSSVRGVITVVRPRPVVLPTSGSGLAFSWVYVGAAVVAIWKAYHATKEEAAVEAAKARADMVPEDEETFANFS